MPVDARYLIPVGLPDGPAYRKSTIKWAICQGIVQEVCESQGCSVVSPEPPCARLEADWILAALKMYRAAHGEEAMWALVPPGVEFLATLLEEVEGLGPEYALEVALKTALGVV